MTIDPAALEKLIHPSLTAKMTTRCPRKAAAVFEKLAVATGAKAAEGKGERP